LAISAAKLSAFSAVRFIILREFPSSPNKNEMDLDAPPEPIISIFLFFVSIPSYFKADKAPYASVLKASIFS
jgi:hypothetical protein